MEQAIAQGALNEAAAKLLEFQPGLESDAYPCHVRGKGASAPAMLKRIPILTFLSRIMTTELDARDI